MLLSFFYKFDKIIPLRKKDKLKLYLDLEWIFDRLAHETSFRVFGDKTHPMRIRSIDFLLKHLRASHRVLDLGCNSGDLTHYIAQHVNNVVGVDSDLALIKDARRKYPDARIKFVHSEAISYIQQTTHEFDVIILSHILEHFDAPEKLLRICNRFSHIYVEVPDFDRSQLNIYRAHLKSGLIYSDADHIWEFDRETLEHLIRTNGLTIVDREFIHGVQKYWCSVTLKEGSSG